MLHTVAIAEGIMTTITRDVALPTAAPRSTRTTVRRIVVATNGVPTCAGAVTTAHALATRHGAHVTAISVFHPRIPYPQPIGGDGHHRIPASDRQPAQVQLVMVRHQLASLGAGDDWALSYTAGNVGVSVTTLAQDHHADLVIIGLGRANPAERGLGDRGSMAIAASVRHPLLAAAPDFAGAPRHVLIAVGHDNSAVQAATFARELFPAPDRVSLVHVTEPGYDESSVPRRFDEVRHALAGWRADIRSWTFGGNPIDALLDFVHVHDVDLVVGGLHGSSFAERSIIRNAVMWQMAVGERSVLLVPELGS